MSFKDALGTRRTGGDPTAPAEILSLRPELSAVPSFEFALRERVSRLAGFRHAYYARVRSVERSSDLDQSLTLISDATPGIRLSDLLAASHERHLPLDIDTALCLIRQLVPAVAILHESARDTAHGALGPERLILAPTGRLVIVEYVLGSALEQLLFSRERYWTELRIALPRVAGLPRFDHLADVTQIGIVALSLILGRLLKDDEYPGRIGEVVSSAMAISTGGGSEPLPAGLRGWLNRALQLDTRHSFPSATEARAEFEKVLADSGYDAAPASVEKFLIRYHAPEQPAPGVALSDTRAVVARPSAPRVYAATFQLHENDSAPTGDAVDAAQPAAVRRVVTRRASGQRLVAAAVAAAAFVLFAGGALLGARRFLAEDPSSIGAGTLAVSTNPPGADAIVDGTRRGTTPLTLRLPVGPHKVELRGAGEPRIIPFMMTPGLHVAQYVDLPRLAPPVEARVDAVPDAVPSEPVAAPAEATPQAGWIAVDGKLEVQLSESGRLLGSSRIDRIMVPAGRHDLELVNDAIGYRATRSLQVTPGKVTTITIDPPKGAIAINALPWAEVWIDGAKAGETPIGNLAVTVGSHEVVFRHPDLGERRETVLVTLKAPLRLSVDLRTK